MSLLRASVLGGVDGIITSFAIASSSHAGGLASKVVFVVGFSSLLADGLSMGISEYVSSSGAEARREKDDGGSTRRTSTLLLGLSCFLSFVVSGTVPISTYLLSNGNLLSCASFSAVCLVLLGAARTFVSGEPLLWGVFQTLSLGSLAGLASFGMGFLLEGAE